MNTNEPFCGEDSGARAHFQEMGNHARDQQCRRAKAQPSLRRRTYWLPWPVGRKSNQCAQNGRRGHRPITTDRRISAGNQILRAPRFHGKPQTRGHTAVLRDVGQCLADREPAISSRPDADPGAIGQRGGHTLAMKSRSTEYLITRGDATVCCDWPVPATSVLGTVIGFSADRPWQPVGPPPERWLGFRSTALLISSVVAHLLKVSPRAAVFTAKRFIRIHGMVERAMGYLKRRVVLGSRRGVAL